MHLGGEVPDLWLQKFVWRIPWIQQDKRGTIQKELFPVHDPSLIAKQQPALEGINMQKLFTNVACLISQCCWVASLPVMLTTALTRSYSSNCALTSVGTQNGERNITMVVTRP